jgi:hypothetical protein
MSGVAGATTVWRHDDGALSRRTPRSVIVLPADAADPLVLEGAAAIVWDELSRPANDDELVGRVAVRAGVPLDDVRADVLSTRAALVDAGAIVETR